MSTSTARMWHVRGERWESIPHRVLRDKRLTFRARGVLCYLLSLPDDWQTSVSRLRDLTPAKEPGQPYEGREALDSAVHELERYGYLYRWLRRTENGLNGYVWAFSADPDALRAMLAEVYPEVVDNSTVSGSSVHGSAGNGPDQGKQGETAGGTVPGSTVDGSPGDLRSTGSKKNWKKNPRAPKRGAGSSLSPICGQCDARDSDPVSARVVWLDEDHTQSVPCPRCHPSAAGTGANR